MKSVMVLGHIDRPLSGFSWHPLPSVDFPFTGGVGWQSNGGPTRSHPHRALPFSCTIKVPHHSEYGPLVRIHLVGIFALWAGHDGEKAGDIGANIFLFKKDQPVFNYNLVCDCHYFEAQQLVEGCRLNGDGSSLEVIDYVFQEGKQYRVDLLTLEVPLQAIPDILQFRSHKTAASFVLFDVVFEFGTKKHCPFRSSQKPGISLTEIGVILRLQDRVKFHTALEQLSMSILSCTDIDEARSLALTFIAVISAALLELDAPKGLHRLQLDMARKLDQIEDKEHVIAETLRVIRQITQHIISFEQSSGSPVVDRAMSFVDKHFARDICDQTVAKYLNMSTSHFRHLFKECMGQPFHKYLVGLRLERARLLLLQTDLSVHDIARSVGFHNISHFCRAFNKRFDCPPSAIRTAKKTNENVCPIHHQAIIKEEKLVS